VAAKWWSQPQPGTDLDATLRRFVVWFQLLGWLWMMLLVVLTLVSDEGVDTAIVVAAAVVATVWTVVVVAVAMKSNYLGTWWFVAVDGMVVLFVGAASTLSGAEDLFHGGFLISWIVLAAYAGGRAMAIAAAVLLTIEQIVVHVSDGRGLIPTAGSVIFFIFALIVGWTIDALRASDAERVEAVSALAQERATSVRREERAMLADQIHDTVLQFLHALKLHAEEPDQVRYLARQQERQLRRSVAMLQSNFEDGYRVALLEARDDVESMYPVEIDPVLRSDAEMSVCLRTVVDAAREAMLNAAAHSGSSSIEVFSDTSDGSVIVYVRDRGSGFDLARLSPHRGIGRCIERIAATGGELSIRTTVGEGTECKIEVQVS
jgi:signal transduction histidine kinase